MIAREDGWTELGQVVKAEFVGDDGATFSVGPGSRVLFAPVGTPPPGTLMTTCPACREQMPEAQRDLHACSA